MPFLFVSISMLLFFGFAFAGDPVTLEKIVVTAREGASTEPFKKNSSMRIISAGELAAKNINTIPEMLNYVTGMDVRTRGSSGIQSDASLRGSTFEEVAVLINGVRVMDPQTGHFNLDIPLTVYDIERIEVGKDGSSALHGAGAFAGSVNIITKKKTEKQLQAQTLFGEHALFAESFSLGLPQKPFPARISFDHAVSKAARPNTDFEYTTASFFLNRQSPPGAFGAGEASAEFGYQKKDFGADSFYSNLYPEEEEHTRTFFWRAGATTALGSGGLKNALFLRKHLDKFLLSRNNPTVVNYHATYVYGMNSDYTLPLDCGVLDAALEAGSEEINSTNLGKHARLHESGSLGFIPELGDRISVDARLRLDYYQKWKAQESYTFGMAYDLIDEKLKARGRASRSFRIPTFTELYYFDPGNHGNAGLKEQLSDAYSVGLECKGTGIETRVDAFARRGRNLIDWTRTAADQPWSASNLGRVDFSGIEFGLNLKNLSFSYVYTYADKKADGFHSKYALDVLKHQYIVEALTLVFGLRCNGQFSYNQRSFGETYFVGNLDVGKKIVYRDFIVEPFVRIENVTNAQYSEVGGVLQPGRWIKGGVKFQW